MALQIKSLLQWGLENESMLLALVRGLGRGTEEQTTQPAQYAVAVVPALSPRSGRPATTEQSQAALMPFLLSDSLGYMKQE